MVPPAFEPSYPKRNSPNGSEFHARPSPILRKETIRLPCILPLRSAGFSTKPSSKYSEKNRKDRTMSFANAVIETINQKTEDEYQAAIAAWILPGRYSYISLLVIVPLLLGFIIGTRWMRNQRRRDIKRLDAQLGDD